MRHSDFPAERGPVGLPVSLSMALLEPDPGPEAAEIRRSFTLTLGPPTDEAPEGIFFLPRGLWRILP